MRFVGLSLGGDFTHMTVLDAVGDLLEEEVLPSTETGLNQRFAAMPPSLIAAKYVPEKARLLASLASMGHGLVLSGPLPETLLPALVPQLLRTGARSVVMRKSGPGVGIAFAAEFPETGGEASGWYFIGPVPAGTELESVALRRVEGGEPVNSLEQARRLFTLFQAGELISGQAPREAAA